MNNSHDAKVCTAIEWQVEKRLQLIMDIINGVTTTKQATLDYNISKYTIRQWMYDLFQTDDINFTNSNLMWKDSQHRYVAFNANAATLGSKRKIRDSLGLTDFDITPEYASYYTEHDEEAMSTKTRLNVTGNVYKDGIGLIEACAQIYPILNFDNEAIGTLVLSNYNIALNNMKFNDVYNLMLSGNANIFLNKNKYVFTHNNNEISLTQREIEIILYLLIGCSSKKIASLLNVSNRTVETIVLQAKNKVQALTTQNLLDIIWKNGVLFETP